MREAERHGRGIATPECDPSPMIARDCQGSGNDCDLAVYFGKGEFFDIDFKTHSLLAILQPTRAEEPFLFIIAQGAYTHSCAARYFTNSHEHLSFPECLPSV